MDRSKPDRTVHQELDEGLEASRREFLKTAGKLAAYTPPAMLVLMKPSSNAIAGSPGGGSKVVRPEEPGEDHPQDDRLNELFENIALEKLE